MKKVSIILLVLVLVFCLLRQKKEIKKGEEEMRDYYEDQGGRERERSDLGRKPEGSVRQDMIRRITTIVAILSIMVLILFMTLLWLTSSRPQQTEWEEKPSVAVSAQQPSVGAPNTAQAPKIKVPEKPSQAVEVQVATPSNAQKPGQTQSPQTAGDGSIFILTGAWGALTAVVGGIFGLLLMISVIIILAIIVPSIIWSISPKQNIQNAVSEVSAWYFKKIKSIFRRITTRSENDQDWESPDTDFGPDFDSAGPRSPRRW